MRKAFHCILLCVITAVGSQVGFADEALPSWNEGPAKDTILSFVKQITSASSANYVEPAKRIAVFDNDGTLWCEKPMYVQLAFAIDRIKAVSNDHPEWKTQQPFKAALEDDLPKLASGGKAGLLKIIAASHTGMSDDEFAAIAKQWLATARHPKYKRVYTKCVYQPMIELLGFLRANQFKTYIVSGGGIDMLRVFAEQVYGIPPEQVIGSSVLTKYADLNGKPTILRLPEISFINDKAGKPVGIQRHIGRRPLAAFGNSDGDYEMLRYTVAGDGLRLGAIVHHTDGDREYNYDRNSHVGKLDRGLDEAEARNFLLIDMKRDWRQIFPD